jgi:hypothetical protein
MDDQVEESRTSMINRLASVTYNSNFMITSENAISSNGISSICKSYNMYKFQNDQINKLIDELRIEP